MRAVFIVFAFFAWLSTASAQPVFLQTDTETTKPSGPPKRRFMLGQKIPLPATSDQDLRLTLKVMRSGQADRKSLRDRENRYFYDEATDWTFGPYELTARLHTEGNEKLTDGRDAITTFLARWQANREHYLDVLDTFRAAQPYNSKTAKRQAYYAKISKEVRRVLEEARKANRDVALLLSLLKRQRSYQLGNKNFGPSDPTSAVTAEVNFAGGQSVKTVNTEGSYFPDPDGNNLRKQVREMKPVRFRIEPDWQHRRIPMVGTQAVPDMVVPNLSIDIMDIAACESDQLEIMLLGFDKRLAALTPAPASAFELTAQELEWYEKTTSALMTRIFRETYRQGVHDVVRYAWAMSGEQMPRAMQLGPANAPKEFLQWHTPFEDLTDAAYWTDGAGVPLIRQDAALHLPANLDGRQIRLYVSEAGGSAPGVIGNLHTYTSFTKRDITANLPAGVKHSLVTWTTSNFDKRAMPLTPTNMGRRISASEISKFEPRYEDRNTRSIESDYYVLKPIWSSLQTTRLFTQASDTIDPEERDYAFSRSPRMHLLQAKHWSGGLKAQLQLRYERNVIKPNSDDIDQGHQDVTIDIELAPVSDAPPLKVCREPVFDDPPELRVVQLWGNEGDQRDDDEYRVLETIWPGHPYFVEAVFEEAPPDDIYRVRVDGGGSLRVTRTKTDSKLYRSEVITFTPEGTP